MRILMTGLLCFAAMAYEKPEFTGEWANGGPYTMSGLSGKLVALYYFEEG